MVLVPSLFVTYVQVTPFVVTVSAFADIGIAAPAAIAAAETAVFQVSFLMQYTSLEFYFPQRLKDSISFFFFFFFFFFLSIDF